MQISGTGAVVGAVVGAFARGAVVILNMGANGADGLAVFALPSAGIGLLVGAIAGALGKPLLGAIVGATLSGLVFEFFMFACASALGGIHGNRLIGETLLYGLEMALAGALAGAVGGFVGSPQTKQPRNRAGTEESGSGD